MIKNVFINRKFCDRNGFDLKTSLDKFALRNKQYYQETEDYDWVKVADGWLGPEAFLHRLRERNTLKLIKKYANGDQFLDAGCGTGLMLRHFPSGSTGLDINPRNLARAKKYAPQANLILGDVEKMILPSRTFTTVVCADVLEHLLKPGKALKEIFRVLVVGGTLIGSVPALSPIWKLRFLSSTHPGEPYHRYFRKKELKKTLKGRGEILVLNRGNLGMNHFFVVKKKAK